MKVDRQHINTLCKCPSTAESRSLLRLSSSPPDMYLVRLCASTSRRLVFKNLSVESVLTGCSRMASGAVEDKKPLKKAKTPQGRFDSLDDKSKDVLEKFPDDVNPVTKEKGGPRGPEPTRYGDWERKGRCVDF
ncbi:succinate dehydrogenase assembly factor 4, mitochondrial [Stegastes partitus]|nr:PREDICTED: UPF0369 protein C6orf57 homolog [Stegastes partitus]